MSQNSNLPVVNFSVDKTIIVEGGDAQILTFKLSEPAPAGGLVVNIRVDDPDGDPGAGDTTFPPEFISNITEFGQVEEDGIITASLTIAEGATEATFGVAAFEDDLVEVGETYSFTLLEDENYIVDSASTTITTTIEDSDFMKPTVSITPRTLISTEGDSLAWKFTLDKPAPVGGLNVNFVTTQVTESTPGDVSFNLEASTGIINFNELVADNVSLGSTITLASGVTEAILVLDTIADDIPETDEIGSYTIADGEDYRANPNQSTVTAIFADRTVVTLTTDEVNVTEGNTFAWNFGLNRPAPEGGLTLSLPITQNNDPEPGDVIYNIEGSTNIEDFGFITQDDVSIGFTLTIPEGETVATLVSEAVVDDVAEFDEIFTTILADGNDYVANPVSNQVVTTIVEGGVAPTSSAPVVSITPSALISTEGDTFAWNFSLDKPVPSGGLTLSLPITQNNDPAPGDVIYNVEGSTGITDFDFIVEDDISIGFSVTLEEGVTSATLVSEAVVDDDDLEEFADEIFTTVLADGVDYRANPDSNEVQTFITGQTVVSFTPEQVNVAEGNTFAWNFSLNQPAPVGGLNLTLPITFNNDPEPGDVEYNVEGSTGITDFSFLVVDDVSFGFNVTIAEGETEATLVSQAVADDLEEGDEIFTTILNDGADYRADPLSREVVTTIVETALPTLSLTAEPTFVNEGEQLKFNFDLTEVAPSGGLTVNLDLVEDTDPLPGDITYFVDGSENITDFELLVNEGTGLIDGATVTIAEGATEATLLSDIIADNATEGPESVKFGLASGNYSIDSEDNAASFTIVDTSTDNEISGTTGDDNLYGTNASEIISGGRGDDNISGNGGMDTLIGGRGDDDIYGGFEADEISGGRGDDFIFGNGGNDLINSGFGFDTVFLGKGEATVILDQGEGFDTIFNFQLGATKFEVSSLDNLNFADSDSGAEIFLQGDKLAVVAGQSAHTFSSNQEMIFAV